MSESIYLVWFRTVISRTEQRQGDFAFTTREAANLLVRDVHRNGHGGHPACLIELREICGDGSERVIYGYHAPVVPDGQGGWTAPSTPDWVTDDWIPEGTPSIPWSAMVSR